MKNLCPILLAVLLPFMFFGTASAQHRSSEPLRPRWINRMPKPTNSTFVYEKTSALAPSLDMARERCLAELIAHSGMKSGVVAVTNNSSDQHLSQVWNNGRLTERIEHDGHTTVESHSAAVKLHIADIAEYWETDRSGNYYLTKLYAKSELDTTPLFDKVELTTAYGARGLWRSMIIPGWGQFHKGANLKGGLMLGGCAALAAGIVFTENQRADYVRKAGQTHDARLIRSYKTKRDHFATARNICIGAAAALYIYNIIDAVAAPGARWVVVHKRKIGSADYAFMPTAMPDGGVGALASITF